MAPRFRDRAHAGRELARELTEYAGRPDVIVLGLPRGGVPVAYEVARTLRAPLDVFIVRKLGLPGHEELGIGAIASGDARVLNADAIAWYGLSVAEIERVVERETRELERRERLYRDGRPFPDLRNRTVILVDDGLATGYSMRVAIQVLRQGQPDAVIVAVPVAADETCEAFQYLSDGVVCKVTPEPFDSVGQWYDDFSQTSDAEVRDLLDRASRESRGAARHERAAPDELGR